MREWGRNQSVLGTGYFLVAREAFRLMQDQDAGGAIVSVASKNSLVAGPHAPAYSTAKAAELHLARCLAAEGGSAGIRVNVVPEDIAQAVLHFASSARSGKSTGSLLDVDGGVAAPFPR